MKHTPGPWKVVNAGPHWNNKATTNFQIQYGADGLLLHEADGSLLIMDAYDSIKGSKTSHIKFSELGAEWSQGAF